MEYDTIDSLPAFDPSHPFEIEAAPQLDTEPQTNTPNGSAPTNNWLSDYAASLGKTGLDAAIPSMASRPVETQDASAKPDLPDFDPSQAFQIEHHPVAGPTSNSVLNATDIGRRAGELVAGPMAAFVSLPRSASEAVDWAGRQAGVNIGASDAMGSIHAPGTNQPLFPDYATARDMAYNTTGGTEYKPETLGGRVVQAGVGAALAGGVRAIPGMLAGGSLAELAKELLPNYPMIAPLAAFVTGQKLGNAAAMVPQRALGMVANAETSPVFQAYKRQGVDTSLTGDVTGNPTLQFLQARAQKTPSAAADILQKAQKAETDWQNAVTKNADALGPSTTMVEAGTALQKSAGSWLNTFKAAQNHLWSAFRDQVPADTQISVSNYQKALGDVAQDFAGAENTAAVLQPQIANQLKKALGVDLNGGTDLPWQSIQAARTRLGQMMETGQGIGDMQQSQLKRLYAGLSQDMAVGADKIGPEASAAFNRASAYTAGGHELLENHIQPILNATNPEAAASWALAQSRLGGSRLQAIEEHMPGSGTDLGSVVLRNAASKGSGNFPAAVGTKALSPEAQSVLFGPAQSGVQDLTTIANARQQSQKWVNHSNSQVQGENGLLGRFLMAQEVGKLGGEAFGPYGRVAGFAAGMAAPGLAGVATKSIVANPTISRMYSTNPMVQFQSPGLASGIPSALSPSLRAIFQNLPTP